MFFKRDRLLMAADDLSGGEGMSSTRDYSSSDVNENFDDMDFVSDASKKLGEDHKEQFKDRIKRAKDAKNADKDQLDEEEEDEKKKPAPKAKKNQPGTEDALDDDADLDGKKVEKKPAKKEKAEKEDDTEADEADEEGEEKADKDADRPKPGADKKIKVRMSDGLYGVEADAKVRVKIDGAFEEPSIQELINSYSGKVAYDKKFTEIGERTKALDSRSAEVEGSRQYIIDTVSEVAKILDDPEADPFAALNILVEKSGRDPYTLWKRSLEANLEEVENLMSMSEPERKAYFLEKKDEFRSKSEKTRHDAFAKQQSLNQALEKADHLRQAHGVSEEQFLKAWDDLEAEGTENPTDELIVDHVTMGPHINTVQDILEPYEDSIDDSKYSSVVQNLARQMRAKEITPEQLKEWATKEFADEDLKDLTARTSLPAKKKAREEIKTPDKFETLDFDDD